MAVFQRITTHNGNYAIIIYNTPPFKTALETVPPQRAAKELISN